MATLCSHQIPTVFFDHLDSISNFHDVQSLENDGLRGEDAVVLRGGFGKLTLYEPKGSGNTVFFRVTRTIWFR